MARSTRLVIKNIYTLWDRKRFLLPVTYFPTKLVYPFTLRLTEINIKQYFKLKESIYVYCLFKKEKYQINWELL